MVGFADLDEARAGCGVVGILVRVVLFGQGEELAFYLLGAGGRGQGEGIVVGGYGVVGTGARVEGGGVG
jgi:hypothetical protein